MVGAQCPPTTVRHSFSHARGERMTDGNDRAITLLVVDDQDLIHRLVQAAVESLASQLLLACSGDDALRTLEEEELPDGIVLDYSMPGKDGVETLQRIRELPGGAAVPVIMLTGWDQTAIRKAAEGLDVYCFMTKPFSPAALCRSVEEMVRGGEE